MSAALWCRFGEDFSATNPSEISANENGRNNFEILMALATLGHIARRGNACDATFLRSYLSYTGALEFAPTISGIDPVARMLRDCALETHTGIVAALEPTDKISDFLTGISKRALLADSPGTLDRGTAINNFQTLQNYFTSLSWILGTGFPPKRIVRGHHLRTQRSPIERLRHDGFIPASESVVVQLSVADNPEEDTPSDTGLQVIVNELNDAQKLIRERSGLAPSESRRTVLKLYHVDEIGSKIRSAQLQSLAAEMGNQGLFWDQRFLTSSELREVHSKIRNTVDRYFLGDKSVRDDAQAALIILIVLHFGVPLEVARTTELGTSTDLEPADTFVIQRSDNKSELIWSLPALSPTYASDMEWDESLSRPRADRLKLADHSGVAKLICAYLDLSGRSSARVFSLEPETANKKIKSLLDSMSDKRINIHRIRNVIASFVLARQRDPALRWILTWDRAKANQSRMYYTRYDTPLLERLHSKICRSMQRVLGLNVDVQVPTPSLDNLLRTSIGARFVLSANTLTELVRTLQECLGTPPDHGQHAELRKYHNAYVLYTWLVQAMTTTYRCVNDPVDLALAWKQDQGLLGSLHDKDTVDLENARLVELHPTLVRQFGHLGQHLTKLQKILGGAAIDTMAQAHPLFILSEALRPEEITEGWIEAELAGFGFKIPGNFHRAYLRTELIHRRCPIEVIDCFLGHAGEGESPFGMRSTFDFGLYRAQLPEFLNPILQDAHLCPFMSRVAG